MIASKEPDHSLGGYFHRERWSHPVKRKEFFVYAGHDEERQEKEQIFLSLYPIFFTIASGATPIGSASRAPDKDEIINYASREINYRTRIGVNY
jgi:hypothetical protein